jgi:hypothetical protein
MKIFLIPEPRINIFSLINIDKHDSKSRIAVIGLQTMNFIRIIIFLAVISPFMAILSGCYNDAFLDAIHEEEDFIAPFDVVQSDEESKRTTYFSITDSGSITSITNGDDGSYNNTPRAVNLEVMDNVNGDGDDIVVDHVTGLTWTKCTATAYGTMDTDDNCSGSETDRLDDPALIEWSKAAATCKNLTYAGHKDWRLPRVPELLTVVDYGKHPSFNPAKFPNTRGDFEVPQYTDKHYSLDDRDRYIKGTNVLGQVIYTKVTPAESTYTSAKYIEEDGEYVFNEMFQDSYKPDDSGNYILAYIPYSSVVHYLKSTGPPVTYIDYSTLGAYTRYIYVEDPPGSSNFVYIAYNSVTHYIKVGDAYINYIAEQHYSFNGTDYVEDAGGAFIRVSGSYVNVGGHLFWYGYYIKLTTNDYIHVATYISSNGEYILYSGEYINVNNQYVFLAGEYLHFDLQDRYNYDSTWGWGFIQNSAGSYIRLFIKDFETEYNPITGIPEPGSNYVKIYIPDVFTYWTWDGTANTPTVTTFPAPPPYQGARSKYRFDAASAKFVVDAAGTYIQKFEKPIGYWTYSSKLLFDNSYNTSEFGWIVYPQNGGTFGVNMSSYSLKVKEDLTFEKQFVRCVRGGNGDSDDVD